MINTETVHIDYKEIFKAKLYKSVEEIASSLSPNLKGKIVVYTVVNWDDVYPVSLESYCVDEIGPEKTKGFLGFFKKDISKQLFEVNTRIYGRQLRANFFMPEIENNVRKGLENFCEREGIAELSLSKVNLINWEDIRGLDI